MDYKDDPVTLSSRPPGLPSRKLRLAQLVLTLERVWPAFFRAFMGLVLMASFTVVGGWQILSPLAHVAVLGTGGAAILLMLIRDIKDLEWPRRMEALKRLQADNDLRHQPLQSLEDTPFSGSGALWRAHQAVCRHQIARLDVKPPRATIDRRDPYCLRYLALFALVLCAILAGPNIGENTSAIKPRPLFAAPAHSATLWLEAPAYTGLAPVTLLSVEAGTDTHDTPAGPRAGASIKSPDRADHPITAPVNTRLEIRISAAPAWWWQRPSVLVKSNRKQARYRFGGRARTSAEHGQISHLVAGDTHIRARIGGRLYEWHIATLEDKPPEIRLERAITVTETDKLEIIAEIADDYGIVQGVARVKLHEEQTLAPDAPAIDPSIAEEVIERPLPFMQGKAGLRSQLLDLTRHPWAGLEVMISIGGCDGAGQCDFTEAQRLTLPQKPFYNDLARVIIAERQALAIAPQSRARTRDTLAALTAAPARFFDDLGAYLLLRSAFWQAAATDAARPVAQLVDEFWTLALHLEDDAVSLARKALEEAQAALRDAVTNGVDTATIARLTRALRERIAAYLEALAQSGQIAPAPGGGGTADAGTLDKLLDQIQDLAGAGASGAAARLLSELDQLLENIQLSDGSSGEGQATGTGGRQNQSVEATGSLINRQREIADATFDAARAQYGLEGGASDPSGARLGATQGALAEETLRFTRELAQSGGRTDDTQRDDANPATQADPASIVAGLRQQQTEFANTAISALNTATRRMEEAAQFLQNEDFAAATLAQDEALDALRKGATALSKAESAQKAVQDAANGDTRPADGPGSRQGDGPAGVLKDPLGRAYIPDPNAQDILHDFSDPSRARTLIEQIRGRLTSGSLPAEERDYLLRLLDRFTPAP